MSDFYADLADRLMGTPDSVEAAIESMDKGPDDFDMNDVEEKLANLNIERCPKCDWWCESGELTDENNEPCECESCRPRTESEDEDGD